MSTAPNTLPWLRPRAAVAGDVVAVISPSGPVRPQDIEPGLELLRSWGLKPEVHPDAFARDTTGYLAGDDRTRLDALKWAIGHPEARVIACTRGGYGAMRLLEALEPQVDAIRRDPKLLVGFSDVTALHAFWSARAHTHSVHGPVLKSARMLGEDHTHGSLQIWRDTLFGQGPTRLDHLTVVQPGADAQGRLLPANLSLLSSLVGSPYCPDLSEWIVCLEDVTEPDYRLDRLMLTLELAGVRPAGIVLGDFTGCAGVYIEQAHVLEHMGLLCSRLGCPVLAGAAFGHGPRNVCLPVGSQATLSSAQRRLDFERPTSVHQEPTP